MSRIFSNNFYERINAIGRWDSLVCMALERGLGEEVKKCKPPKGATRREIEKASEKLGAAIIAHQRRVRGD